MHMFRQTSEENEASTPFQLSSRQSRAPLVGHKAKSATNFFLLAAAGLLVLAAGIGFGTARYYTFHSAGQSPPAAGETGSVLGGGEDGPSMSRDKNSKEDVSLSNHNKNAVRDAVCAAPMLLKVSPRSATWLGGKYKDVTMLNSQTLYFTDGINPFHNIHYMSASVTGCSDTPGVSSQCCNMGLNMGWTLFVDGEFMPDSRNGIACSEATSNLGDSNYGDIVCNFNKEGNYIITSTRNSVDACKGGHSFRLSVTKKKSDALTELESSFVLLQAMSNFWGIGDYSGFNEYIVAKNAYEDGLIVPADRRVVQGDVLRFTWGSTTDYVSLVAVKDGNRELYDSISFQENGFLPSVWDDCTAQDYATRTNDDKTYFQWRSVGADLEKPNQSFDFPLIKRGWHYFAAIGQSNQGNCYLGQKLRVYVHPNPSVTWDDEMPDPSGPKSGTDSPFEDSSF